MNFIKMYKWDVEHHVPVSILLLHPHLLGTLGFRLSLHGSGSSDRTELPVSFSSLLFSFLLFFLLWFSLILFPFVFIQNAVHPNARR